METPVFTEEYLNAQLEGPPSYGYCQPCNNADAPFADGQPSQVDYEHDACVMAGAFDSGIEFPWLSFQDYMYGASEGYWKSYGMESCLATCSRADCAQPAYAAGDVHVHHAGGGAMDVRGYDGAVMNMHQAANLSLNARFTYTNFSLPASDRRSEAVREVRGSHLTAAYVTARTILGGVPVLVMVGYEPPRVHALAGDAQSVEAQVRVKDEATQRVIMETRLAPSQGRVVLGEVVAEMREAKPVELVVSNAEWQYSVTPGTFRPVLHDALALGPPHNRVDVGITALTDPRAARVAPHGIIGQGFDGRHIDGKKDDYVPDAHGVFVTSAQGEGGLEGTAADYVVAPSDPFSAAFRFGRFDRVSAQPRDISKLGTDTAHGAKQSLAGLTAGAVGDSAPRPLRADLA